MLAATDNEIVSSSKTRTRMLSLNFKFNYFEKTRDDYRDTPSFTLRKNPMGIFFKHWKTVRKRDLSFNVAPPWPKAFSMLA